MRVEHLSDDVTLMLGNCLDLLGGLPNVDAVITDPPYSVSLAGSSGSFTRTGNKGTRSMSFFEGDTDWAAMTASVVESLKLAMNLSPSSIYCWCGHRQFGPLTEAFEANGYSTRFLVWKKTCPAPAPPGSGWQSAAELCLYAYKPGRTFKRGQFSNVLESDSYRFGQPGKVDHPTQKPFGTIRPLLEVSTGEGETILDPFMGSGTTGVACIQLGRKFVGIELEPKYFDIACRRIADELRRPRLQLEPVAKPIQEAMSL